MLQSKLEEAFNNHQNGNTEIAKNQYIEILQENPENAQVLDLLGVLYYQIKDYSNSKNCLEKAVSISPKIYYIEHLAKLYLEMKNYDDAKELYSNLVSANPNYENYFFLGKAYKELHDWQNSAIAYKKALEYNSNGYEAYFNLAHLEINQNCPQKAVEYYEKAIQLNPNDWEAKYFLSLAYMQAMDYKNGFEFFESRLCRKSAIVTQQKQYPKQMSAPIWKGEDLTGKTLFTYYEAGFGDLIMLYRYMPILTKMCKKVIFRPQKELAPLFRQTSYGAEIIDTFDPDYDMNFDYHLPFLSVPYVLDLQGKDVFTGHDKKYLSPNENKVEEYRQKYFNNDKFKIGIKWQGNTTYDLERVLRVEDFYRLFELPNTQFYSCQTFGGSEEVNKFKDKYNVIDLGTTFGDFLDTASALENMDLVIANDTSLVHLAGALQKRCWVLLPHIYNWRWHTDLSKCDWYDSVKIFRQKDFGDWESVFVEVEKELRSLLDN